MSLLKGQQASPQSVGKACGDCSREARFGLRPRTSPGRDLREPVILPSQCAVWQIGCGAVGTAGGAWWSEQQRLSVPAARTVWTQS